jgi:hypothetical protein
MAVSNTVLTTSPSAVYTSSGNTVVTLLYFCNTSGGTRTVNVYVVPSGGSATSSTQIYKNVSITASDTLIIDSEKIILENGDKIFADADSNTSVTTTVGYIAL